MATENNSVASLLLATGRVTSPSPALFLSRSLPLRDLSLPLPLLAISLFSFFRKERDEKGERREMRERGAFNVNSWSLDRLTDGSKLTGAI